MILDNIRPEHYRVGNLEAWDVIDAAGFAEGFYLGNVIKYTLRYTKRGNVDDLRKARTYLDRHIAELERRERAAMEQHSELAK